MSATAGQASAQRIAHFSPDTPMEEIFAAYRRDRAVIIDELVSPEQLGVLQVELEEALFLRTSNTRGDDAFLGSKTKRIGGVVAQIPASRPLATSPLVVGLMQRILGERSKIQINVTQGIGLLPGEVRQPIHRDHWLWSTLPLPNDFERMVNCMWAVTDFTEENGATHVSLRSFELPDPAVANAPNYDEVFEGTGAKLPDGRLLEDLETLQAEMKAGSVLLYSGSLYHGGGANRSDQTRLSLILGYIPAELRQEENQYLVVPPEVARELPEELQKLLGYDLGSYALGFVDGMESPMTLLR